MSFASLLIHTVTVYPYSPGTEDRYGNPTDDWGAGVATPARVDSDATSEDLMSRDTRHTLFTVFLPATVTINALSKVEWDGRTLQVVGEPAQLNDAVGVQHIEAVCEVFEG
jgi:hypothetical protein